MRSLSNYKFLKILILIQFLFVVKIYLGQQNNIELNSVDFIGNDFFDSADLEDIITSKEMVDKQLLELVVVFQKIFCGCLKILK